MDTHGGYSYGFGQQSARRSSNGYSAARRTTSSTAFTTQSYLPSLQRCVATLEMSTQLLKSSLSMLDEVTSGYPRLKTITSHTKKFELVSEQDIASAQADVSKKVEPQLFALTDKAVEIVLALESKEYQLMDKVHIEKEKEQQRLQRQKAAKSGLSNIKKLQSLTRRKDELTRSALELDEVLDQKREEFNELVKKANILDSQSGQPGSVKRAKHNHNHESRELSRKEEERNREVAKRTQELRSIQQKIEDKRKSISEARARMDSQGRASNPPGQPDFDPTKPWTMYNNHYAVLEHTLQSTLKVGERDTDVYEEAFARLSAAYVKELDARQAQTDKEQDKLMRDHTRTLSQMRNLCKLLFPEESIGLTMVRLLELLAGTWENEVYYENLVQKSKKSKKTEETSGAAAGDLDQISNFFILPLQMPSITVSPSSPHNSASYKNVLHYIYFKKHESPKEDSKTPKNRTLFVLNIPVDATETHLRDLFKPCGRVVSVHFINKVHDTNMTKEEREQQEELERLEKEAAMIEAESGNKTKGSKKGSKSKQAAGSAEDHSRTLYATGSQAYVVFLEEQELTKALTMKRKKRSWINTGGDATPSDAAKLSSLGVSKWINEYHMKRPEASVLQVKVDDYMEKFERSEYEAQQAALARLNVMDEDGFTLVTRAGKGGHNTDGVITVTAAKAEDVKNLKPKKKELQDFYRFQMREAKRDKLVDLRRKFEEDKMRIEALKVNRRFKPY
ncbi:Ribosomal RNA-processing protein 7 [Mortierella alpina]|nr:Ribosomal RNA-processing protein 7 [Mortierella alpina]